MASPEASNLITREQMSYALKVIKVVKEDLADPKQNFANEIKEICDSLNDYGICVTYVIAASRKSSKEILKLLSPYLLKNANDLEYIEQYIPNIKECIKESNQNDSMELLAKPEIKEYLEKKLAKLADKSPTFYSTDLFDYDNNEVKAMREEPIASAMVETAKEIPTPPPMPEVKEASAMVEIAGENSAAAVA